MKALRSLCLCGTAKKLRTEERRDNRSCREEYEENETLDILHGKIQGVIHPMALWDDTPDAASCLRDPGKTGFSRHWQCRVGVPEIRLRHPAGAVGRFQNYQPR